VRDAGLKAALASVLRIVVVAHIIFLFLLLAFWHLYTVFKGDRGKTIR